MATFTNTALRDTYDIAFQVSPIIFHNGIASSVPGGYLPVVALLGGLGLIKKAIAGGGVGLEDFAFRFRPMPGSTIVNQAVGMYPFANQSVAANATIQEPTSVSLRMIAPTFLPGGYATKLAQTAALKALFEKHNNAGGSYVVLTPANIYTDVLMTLMTDITGGETKQDQVEWQLDFIKPLVSISAAKAALSSLMSKASGGQQVTSSSWSGTSTGAGTSMPGSGGALSFGNQNFLSSITKLVPGFPSI